MSKPTVHILYGSNDLEIQRYVDELIVKADDKANASMNITRLDGASLDFNELNTAVNTLSFLSDGRLVILSNTFKAFTGENKKIGDEKKKKMLDLIASMPASTTLVLIEILEPSGPESRKIGLWMKKLRSLLPPSVNVITNDYSFPNQYSVVGWIVKESHDQAAAHNKQIQIDMDAAKLLAELAETDTRIISQEVSKLLEYVDYERNITKEDVLNVSSFNGEANIFDMVDALSSGDGKQAQLSLDRLLQNEDPRLAIWPMIIRQFRLLLQAREVLDAGGGLAGIEKELGVHPYVAEKLYKQALHLKLPNLEQIYQRLLELEDDVKMFKIDYPFAMDILIAELAK